MRIDWHMADIGMLGGDCGVNDVKQLKPGDPCPICGQPIKREDPEALFVLSVLADLIEGARQADVS